MIALAQRNMKIFFRDRTNVFFSMLVVFITLALYVLFLADNLASGMSDLANARALVDKWLVAGTASYGFIDHNLRSLWDYGE